MLTRLLKILPGLLVTAIFIGLVWRYLGPVAMLIVYIELILCLIGYLLGRKSGALLTLMHLVFLDFGFLYGGGWRVISDQIAESLRPSGALYSTWLGFVPYPPEAMLGGLLGLSLAAIPLILFWVGLAGFSVFLLPVHPWEWGQATRCLMGYVTGYHYSYHVVKGDKIEQRARGKLMAKGQFPGLVLAEAHTAVPLSTGVGLSRVAGPGVTFIGRAERPYQDQVVDLRLHLRPTRARATTRDGIDVEFLLFVVFGIEQQPPARPPVSIAPFSEAAVFQAVLNQRSDADKYLKWDQVPLDIAKDIARRVVAEYYLDRLLEDETQEGTPRLGKEIGTVKMPRDRVRETIMGQLRAEVLDRAVQNDKTLRSTAGKPYGIRIAGVGLGNIEVAGAKDEDRNKAKEHPETPEVKQAQTRVELADEVRKNILRQRVANWRAIWEADCTRQAAQSEAEAQSEISRARAESQLKMIQALADGFSEAKAAGVDTPAEVVVLLRLLDAIEDMAQEPGMREQITEELKQTEADIRRVALQTAG